MKCRKAYAIMPVGKKDESAHCGTQKAPEVATPGLFYSVVARAEIMEKYQTTEQDKTMYLLQSAHVEEGDYFRSRVHKDMDGILEDIRNAHVGRNDGAPKTSVAEELRQDLEEVAAFEGSRAEQLLLVFCKQTKLRYNKLTEEEKQALMRIMQKSELMKSPISQRGRKK